MVYDVFQRILSLQKISSNFEAIFKDKQSFLREKEMLTLKKKEEREGKRLRSSVLSLSTLLLFAGRPGQALLWGCKEAGDEVALLFVPV